MSSNGMNALRIVCEHDDLEQIQRYREIADDHDEVNYIIEQMDDFNEFLQMLKIKDLNKFKDDKINEYKNSIKILQEDTTIKPDILNNLIQIKQNNLKKDFKNREKIMKKFKRTYMYFHPKIHNNTNNIRSLKFEKAKLKGIQEGFNLALEFIQMSKNQLNENYFKNCFDTLKTIETVHSDILDLD